MTPAETGQDRLTRHLDAALGAARVVRPVLLDRVVPHLPPLHRSTAQHVVRQIDGQRIVGATMLQDLEALIAVLEREAEAGTHHGWACDDQDDHPGWPTIHRDARAEALAGAAGELRRFHAAIALVLDTVEAERIADRLFTET